MTRILIAEADGLMAAFLVKGVTKHGVEATVVDDGRQALLLASSGEYDLLIADSRIPDSQSIATIRMWEEPRIPVVVLDGERRPAEMAARFGVRAYDVLPKPFRIAQLLARLTDHLGSTTVSDPSVLQIGEASLDLRTRELTLGRRHLALTAVEFALAAAFFKHPGRMLTGEELATEREGSRDAAAVASVETDLNELNRKVGRELIRPVHRVEYRLQVREENGSPV